MLNNKLAPGCRPQGTCMSLNQSQFWVGASAQHMTSWLGTRAQRPVYKGQIGSSLINARLTEYVRLPMGIGGIYRCRINGRLAIGEPERMHQFVEWAPAHQGSLARCCRCYSLAFFGVSLPRSSG